MSFFAKEVTLQEVRGFESLPLRIPHFFMQKRNEQKVLQWEFPESPSYERGTAWYFWTTLVIGVFVIGAIASSNFLLVLIIILIVTLFILYERRGVRILQCEIANDGIRIGTIFYPYDGIDHFRIIYNPPTAKYLSLTFHGVLQPRVTIALVNENPLAVRALLSRFVREDIESEGEPLIDMLLRWLKL